MHRYRSRISAPLLDRIDLHVEVGPLSYLDMTGPAGETSAAVATRVAAARKHAAARLRQTGARVNADLPPFALRAVARLDEAGTRLLEQAIEGRRISARGHDRLLRVARTLADLEAQADIGLRHLAEALQFRALVEELPG